MVIAVVKSSRKYFLTEFLSCGRNSSKCFAGLPAFCPHSNCLGQAASDVTAKAGREQRLWEVNQGQGEGKWQNSAFEPTTSSLKSPYSFHTFSLIFEKCFIDYKTLSKYMVLSMIYLFDDHFPLK